MLIGYYSDCEVFLICGMVNVDGMIICEDEFVSFFYLKYIGVQIMWF